MKTLKSLLRKNKIEAFTMTEIIVATVIFTLGIAGLFTTISSLRQPAIESTQEVTAAFIGKRILEDLRGEVNAASWDSGKLATGTHTMSPINVDGRSYNATYTVLNDPAGTNARQVTLNIIW